ncbi:MAG: FAD-dependent oxidoreductase [Rhodoplanes sp.]
MIGGGIAGLSVAYELAAAGQSVVVLDPRADRRRDDLPDHRPSRFHHRRLLSGADPQTRPRMREAVVRQPGLRRQPDRAGPVRRADRLRLRAGRRLSVPGGGRRPRAALARTRRRTECRDGRAVAGQSVVRRDAGGSVPSLSAPGAVHPLKYLNGLLAAIGRWDGKVFGDSPVVSVEETEGGVAVKTEHGPSVRARAAVVATNSPINNRVALHSKQAPYRTYAIAGEVLNGPAISSLSQPEETSAESEAGTKTSA